MPFNILVHLTQCYIIDSPCIEFLAGATVAVLLTDQTFKHAILISILIVRRSAATSIFGPIQGQHIMLLHSSSAPATQLALSCMILAALQCNADANSRDLYITSSSWQWVCTCILRRPRQSEAAPDRRCPIADQHEAAHNCGSAACCGQPLSSAHR